MRNNPRPLDVWRRLQDGNRRFVEGRASHPHADEARRQALTGGQSPQAVVVACSDSRVPVEVVFDVGLGDVFVVRTAGEILDPAVLGSVEFAVHSLGVRLVVVMGHEGCGAVAAASRALDEGAIPGGLQRVLVEKVAPSVLAARRQGRTAPGDFERVHVEETIEQLLGRINGLQGDIDAGEVGLVGLRYRLGDGSVETLREEGLGHPAPARQGSPG